MFGFRVSPGQLMLLAAAAMPSVAVAQTGSGGQVELGVYGLYTRFDPAGIGLQQQGGVGSRLAFFVNRLISVEANGDYTTSALATTGRSTNVARVGGALLFNIRLGGQHAMYIGGGYEQAFYRDAITADQSGIDVLLGDRLPLSGRAALRLEGRAAYVPKSTLVAGTDHVLNMSATVGISIFSFGGPKRDADKDGVSDGDDKCPATPTGALVDLQGCPLDTDADRVFDGLDQCPATPAGATVDPRGCPSDSDKDAVFDGVDRCPDTPAGATVDARGCPSDSDADGVLDGLDQCANTPTGAKVDVHGCPTDGDGDLVFDGLDQCPDTPPHTEVDAKGCTVARDADHDGVDDSKDRCLNTAPGVKVDALGCPIIVAPRAAAPVFEIQAAQRHPVILRGVTFASGRSALLPASFATLDQVAASLVENPTVKVEISGHTDATGVRRTNVDLSLARALAVRAYLTQKGVGLDRMVAKGYGPDRPLGPNTTAAGRAQNRRVELSIIP
jgi:outer membrane protein OmpA-like peptidoglycan-associated protein